ncbi:hypothetical protein G4E03_003458 [Salmonella enterica]|nr:hypothetical protein [Salmonella enterica]
MADLMRALRNAHEAGDTEAATRIAAMIKNQQGGSNAPTAPQEAPQEAQPVSNPNPQPTTEEAPTEPQSALERGFNAVGETAAGMGRIVAGGVAGVANVGVGALNYIGQGVQQASNAITGEDAQYTPIAPAGYGSLDPVLMPRGGAEQLGSDIITYTAGGELAAPIKAAEGAGIIARVGTSLVNNATASAAGSVSKYNSGSNAGDVLGDMALNAVAGTALEKVGGAAVEKIRNILPEGLGGYSQAEKAATVANPDFVARVLQGGDTEAQQAFRTATTDEAGNTILNPSQALNTEAGAKYIRAEQRDLSRGTSSEYAGRLDQQKSGEGLQRAVEQNTTPATGDVGNLQQAAQDVTSAFKTRANELYTESKAGAQKILDDSNVSQLKMPQSKQIATAHLEDSAASGHIKLTADARRTMTQFNKAEFKTIEDLSQWKRTLNEKAQKAYRSGDYSSYNALTDLKRSLVDEGDQVLGSISPQAASFTRDADKFYSQSVGDFGDKSILGKIAGKDNPDLAANALIRGQNAEYNTQQVLEAIQRGNIPEAQALGEQLGGGLGEAVRQEALRAATTGENFSATKFVNALSRLEPQSQIAGQLSTRSEQGINQALADSVRAMRERATVSQTNGLLAQAVGRGTGGTIGAMVGGGPVGGLIGQEVGGRVTSAINQGFLDRLAGTVKKGNEYVAYLSEPANAKAVSDILAARGADFDTATAKEVKGIIDNIRKGTTASLLADPNQNKPDQELPVTLPKLPEPEQHAQAAKVEEPAPELNPIKDDKFSDAKRFYKSISSAETGGLDNRFIRTKAAEAGPSTAYGPAQITVTLADSFAKKHSDLFTKSELDYLKRFSEQGHKMLKADANDPVYGYGGTGDLTSKEDQSLYARVAVKMLHQMRKDHGGSYDKTLRAWRGADDKKYFAKVREAMKQTRQPKPARKSMSRRGVA